MHMYEEITECRICGNKELVPVLDLGTQVLTGVFPRTRDESIDSGPLQLVKCNGGTECCGLVQLRHTYDLGKMYGMNYGYRSGLNADMVRHLQAKVARILSRTPPPANSLVLDIGSNDGTTLRAYPSSGIELVGIDPTGSKFKEYYPAHVALIPDFFSAAAVKKLFGTRKASVITSFSMFYDLEKPQDFVNEIASVLADDGVWVFEQSYLPTMLDQNSYDTVCHEHLEYYGLTQIAWMAERAGLVLIDVEFNDVNGGSISVTAARKGTRYAPSTQVAEVLQREKQLALHTLAPFREFEKRTQQCRDKLRDMVRLSRKSGREVFGLGASTKGNVILQYCGFGPSDISAIGEVNPDKFGTFTPGSLVPIRPEEELLDLDPDFFLVLPWHFRRFFQVNPSFKGRRLLFPMPEPAIAVY